MAKCEDILNAYLLSVLDDHLNVQFCYQQNKVTTNVGQTMQLVCTN